MNAPEGRELGIKRARRQATDDEYVTRALVFDARALASAIGRAASFMQCKKNVYSRKFWCRRKKSGSRRCDKKRKKTPTHLLVRSVEATDAEMDDASLERGAVALQRRIASDGLPLHEPRCCCGCELVC